MAPDVRDDDKVCSAWKKALARPKLPSLSTCRLNFFSASIVASHKYILELATFKYLSWWSSSSDTLFEAGTMLFRSATATSRSPALRALSRATTNPASPPLRIQSASAFASRSLSNRDTLFSSQAQCIAGASRSGSRKIPAFRAFTTTAKMVRTTNILEWRTT